MYADKLAEYEYQEGVSLGKQIASQIKSGMDAEQCARAAYAVLCAASRAGGQKPEIECMVKGPDDDHYAGKCWIACWESGPYEWGIGASMEVCSKVLAEPYYSFDLCFYPNEGLVK